MHRSQEVLLSQLLIGALVFVDWAIVAKLTIAICALVFLLNSHPLARLCAVITCGIVLILNRLKEHFQRQSTRAEEESAGEPRAQRNDSNNGWEKVEREGASDEERKDR
mmetsp:Transcript_9032/g.25983  ORF Transcript_9032/g.25983 Transcript_9032/m.25983 type:complete len:109 (+) Transcript_9032:427-753(+)